MFNISNNDNESKRMRSENALDDEGSPRDEEARDSRRSTVSDELMGLEEHQTDLWRTFLEVVGSKMQSGQTAGRVLFYATNLLGNLPP
jgi:hypothetical protein